MDKRMNELSQLAKVYCLLIESADETDIGWLRELYALLPQLHAAITALGAPPQRAAYFTPDLDERFERFARLRRLLGHRDAYWMEFDVAPDEQGMSGSLADDLTDIYCELKHGLHLLEDRREPERAFDDWCCGYQNHWGQHLLDAERHLYELATRNQL
ncbi:hypothetical protein AAY24_11180 [Sedimenticola thiotaurini]|uniref:DUF5063 domain-containing protein n=2 Tax=Sedimenticola thiotaurini TaxID=1543721 RepID=A0A0F7JWE0_9GAMM|nr:hypothetical protein AAY24_11180 [Sedimenticola thiotaurini]